MKNYKKITVTGDSHGENVHGLLMAKEESDYYVDCGDVCNSDDYIEKNLKDRKWIVVKGNGDDNSNLKETESFEVEGVKFFVCHGHNKDINNLTLSLEDNSVLLMGHTHHYEKYVMNNVLVVNSGSITNSRDSYYFGTYCNIYVYKKDKRVEVEMVTVSMESLQNGMLEKKGT